jgi:hypothetical protein
MFRLLVRFIEEERKKVQWLNADILIYQMAKVGSYGVYKSLKADGCSVSHLHLLSNGPSFCVGHSRYEKVLLRIRGILSAAVMRLVIRFSKRDYKIITMVREPLGRNISLMFQAFSDLLKPTLVECGGASAEVDEMGLLSRMFSRINPDYPRQWFDGELKTMFGVDVFAHPFDKEQGFCVIQGDRVSVLVLRTEDLSHHEETIREFTGDAEFRLRSDNRASRKWYAGMHRRFVDEFAPGQAELDRLYGSDYMKHFYTDQHIEEFRRKWSPDRENQ